MDWNAVWHWLQSLGGLVGAEAVMNIPGRGYRFALPLATVSPLGESSKGPAQPQERIAARAAGKPSILVPLPFAADDHQRKNAHAMLQAGAASMVEDRDMNGERFSKK